MRYGIFVAAQHPARDDPAVRLAEHLEQVRFVRDTGFHSVVAGHHYLAAPYQMLQPVPLLARLAAAHPQMMYASVRTQDKSLA